MREHIGLYCQLTHETYLSSILNAPTATPSLFTQAILPFVLLLVTKFAAPDGESNSKSFVSTPSFM